MVHFRTETHKILEWPPSTHWGVDRGLHYRSAPSLDESSGHQATTPIIPYLRLIKLRHVAAHDLDVLDEDDVDVTVSCLTFVLSA
jgi:hypothetical protein